VVTGVETFGKTMTRGEAGDNAALLRGVRREQVVAEALLERKVPAGQIVAAGRDIAKIHDLADRGVQLRALDYADSATLR